jgi:hypothetical protein
MFGGMLDKVTGLLDQRLVLTSLLPAIAFWAVVAGLAGSQAGWQRVDARWNHLDSTAHILLTVIAIALLVLFALVLAASEGALLGLYEGYWGDWPPGRWLASPGKRWHAWRRKQAGSNYEFIYRNYPRYREPPEPPAAGEPVPEPRPEQIMPTRLGNIIKAAELYPGDEGRYGMDAVFFWPRLYQVIPDSARNSLDDARTSMTLMLNICTLALVISAGAFIALVFWFVKPADAWWAAAGGGAVAAWLGYRSALGPARVYGDLVRSMYDLYRGDLLAKLGFALPATLAGEQELWQNLGERMYRRLATSPDVLDQARAKAVAAAQAAPDDASAGSLPTA